MGLMEKMTYRNRRKTGLLGIGIGLALQVFGPGHWGLIDFFKGLFLAAGILLILWKTERKKEVI